MKRKFRLVLCLVLCAVFCLSLTLAACDFGGDNETPNADLEIRILGGLKGDKVMNINYDVNDPKDYLDYIREPIQGYTFKGLYDQKEGGTQYADDHNSLQMKIDKNITLYEQWEPLVYTIRFHAEHGIEAPASINVKAGESINLPNLPSMGDRELVAWTSRNGYTSYSEGNELLTEYMKLDFNVYKDVDHENRIMDFYMNTAERKVNVTFFVNGVSKKVSIKHGTILSALDLSAFVDVAEENGDHFEGWSTITGEAGKHNLYQGAITENITLYAVVSKTYKVSYYETENSAPIVKKGIEGNKIEFYKPIRVGYEFIGWYDSETLSGMPISNREVSSDENANKFYAGWSPIEYTIRFVSVDGMACPAPIKVNAGDPIILPTVADLGAKKFVAWTNKDGSCNYADINGILETYRTLDFEVYSEADHFTRTINFFMKVEDKYVTGKFIVDGLISEKQIKYGTNIKDVDVADLISKIETNGLYFDGWSKLEGTDGKSNIFTGNIYEDITLYPVTYDSVNVNFYEIGVNTSNTIKHKDGSKVEFYTPVRNGYEFTGWYDNAALFGTPITSAVANTGGKNNYYAGWNKLTYNITFVTTGASVPTMTYQIGSMDVLPESTPINEGYKFVGWCATDNFSDAPITALSANMYGDITLYAKFEAKSYTINFDSNGGSFVGDTVVKYNELYSVPVPTYAGHEFAGWFDSADVAAIQYTDANGNSLQKYSSNADSTFVAKWVVNKYTVTFDSVNGSAVPSILVEHGKTATAPANPTLVNYMFSGWYVDADYTTEYLFTELVTEPITLYAKWIQSTAITTAADLKKISENPRLNYHLTSDVNMNSEEWTPISEFMGVLDGRGHKIFNFTMTNADAYDVYGFVAVNSGEIKNLVFDDFNIVCSDTKSKIVDKHFGIVAGTNKGKITNCTTTSQGQFNATYGVRYDCTPNRLTVGGIVGLNYKDETVAGVVSNCTMNTPLNISSSMDRVANSRDDWVSVANDFGGIVGKNDGAVMYNRISAVLNIRVYAGGGYYCTHTKGVYSVGGVVGRNEGECAKNEAHININYNAAEDKGDYYGDTESRIGGVVGTNHAVIDQCYGELNTTLTNDTGSERKAVLVGGCIGWNETVDASASDCYAKTVIKENISNTKYLHLGGFVGANDGKIIRSYAEGTIAETGAHKYSYLGGFVGENKQTANIMKCFASVNIATAKPCTSGYFVGVNDQGSFNKCSYNELDSITVGGEVKTTQNNTIGEAKTLDVLKGAEFIFNVLYWDNTIWSVNADSLPTLKWMTK